MTSLNQTYYYKPLQYDQLNVASKLVPKLHPISMLPRPNDVAVTRRIMTREIHVK